MTPLSRQDRFNLSVTPIFNEEMGARLKIAREKLNITQAELAKKLHISQPTLSRIERGQMRTANFNVTQLEIIFNGAGMSFIVIGANAEKFTPNKDYWKRQHKKCGVGSTNQAREARGVVVHNRPGRALTKEMIELWEKTHGKL